MRASRPARTSAVAAAKAGSGQTQIEKPDHYRQRNGDDACSYCGSMSGDELMAGLESGTLMLGPTDKSYKAYIHKPYTDAEIADLKEKWKAIGMGRGILETKGHAAYEEWFEKERRLGMFFGRQLGKFYFQHLSEPQMLRFIEMLNEKKLKIGYPGPLLHATVFHQLRRTGRGLTC